MFRLVLLEDWMGSGWMTSPGGPWFVGKEDTTSHCTGNGEETEEMAKAATGAEKQHRKIHSRHVKHP